MDQPGVADVGPHQVQLFQPGEALDFLQAGVRALRVFQGQAFELSEPRDDLHPGVGDLLLVAEFQALQVDQRLQVLHAGVGDFYAPADVQQPQFGQPLQMGQPFVAGGGVQQLQPLQCRQLLQMGQPGVGDAGAAAEVQALELLQRGERSQPGVGDGGVLQREILEAGQFGDVLNPLVGDFRPPQDQFVELLQPGDLRQVGIRRLSAVQFHRRDMPILGKRQLAVQLFDGGDRGGFIR